MSRRLQPCRTCKPGASPWKLSPPRGFTRHADRICAKCRASLRQRAEWRLLLVDPADVRAPTREELVRGLPLEGFLEPYPNPFSWRGRGG